MSDDEKWMRQALNEAHKALECGEVPIGAVVVAGNRVISRGHNMTESLHDTTAHAEMIAITAAEAAVGKYLPECSLYVTVEPCLMCSGAIGWSHIGRVVYGASDPKRGYSTFMKAGMTPFHPKSTVITGVLEEECAELMKEFFREKR